MWVLVRPWQLQDAELGDSCFGHDMLDFCVRAFGCMNVVGDAAVGGTSLRVAAGLPYASNYRLEVYTGQECQMQDLARSVHRPLGGIANGFGFSDGFLGGEPSHRRHGRRDLVVTACTPQPRELPLAGCFAGV
eukprot:5602703-Amphidinium_carterae.1